MFRLQTMLIVNYYPGSLGDTVIAELTGLPITRDEYDRVCLDYPAELKQVEFYEKTLEEQHKIYNTIKSKNINIIGAHRFNNFDFKLLDPTVNVISINPGGAVSLVAKYYKNKVHFQYPHWNLAIRKLIKNIETKYGKESTYYEDIIVKHIKQWTESNILATDTQFDLQTYLDDQSYIKQFKI